MVSRRHAASGSAAIGSPAGDPSVLDEPSPVEVASKVEGPRRHRWRRWILGAALLGLGLLAAVFYYLWHIPLPGPPPLPQASVLYDANGRELASFSVQNRVDVTLSQVPPVVINAVVSTEDRHYFTEGAINPPSMMRAFVADVTGSRLQGGSTITQQYVKQAYVGSKRTVIRKIKEAALSIRLSHRESKDQILQNYLNIIYWGRGAYGVEAASRAYFGRDVSQLGLAQASLLAALIREPESADPARDPTLARSNQAETLKAMVRDKRITQAQAAAAEAQPFARYVLAPPAEVSKAQSAALGDDYFIAAVHQQLNARYGPRVVDGGGLRVTTTFDPTLQAEAYGAVYGRQPGHLNPAAGDPSGALVAVDDGGHVKALVGGQDFSKSSVDLALGAAGGGSGRQAGSTFKAFMLAAVIKEGFTVQSVFSAPPKVILPHGNANGTPWIVTNFEDEHVAPRMNLVDATALSVNTVYAQIVAKLGAAKLDAMAEAMGIRPGELAGAYPSQVLGTADVSPLEMATAYSTLANGGVYHTPILITKVTRANGSPLPLPVAQTTRKVLTPAQAAVETFVLQQVVQRGTGVAAGGVGSAVAGKTGTTERSTDAWFVGYTPKLTAAMWIGHADSARSMDGFRGLSQVTGGTIPAQLWHNFMAEALKSFPQDAGGFPTLWGWWWASRPTGACGWLRWSRPATWCMPLTRWR